MCYYWLLCNIVCVVSNSISPHGLCCTSNSISPHGLCCTSNSISPHGLHIYLGICVMRVHTIHCHVGNGVALDCNNILLTTNVSVLYFIAPALHFSS